MLAPTHSVFGLFLTLILLAVFGVEQGLHWVILTVAIIGSLAPDIDLPSSLIGKIFFFISKPLERNFGHRTVTHSFLGWAIASLIFGAFAAGSFFLFDALHWTPLIANFFDVPKSQAIHHLLRVITAFSIGYASHILLDMFNPRGVQLLWPNDARDVIPGNPKFRPNAGSKAELAIFVTFTLLLSLALPISSYGLMTSLRWLLATPAAAIEEFQTSPYRTYVYFEGIDNTTKKHISGTGEILETQNKRLIILFPAHPPSLPPSLKLRRASKLRRTSPPLQRTAGASAKASPQPKIYSLSDDTNADITTTKVRAIKTKDPVTITTFTFDDQSADALLAKLTDADLVSGTIILPDNIKLQLPTTKAIHQTGNKLTLTFAAKAQLQALRLTNATLKHQSSLNFQLATLTEKRHLLQQQLDRTFPKSDLTPLGQSILNKPNENLDAKREALQLRLEQLDHQIETIEEQIDGEKLLLSGEVRVRRVDEARLNSLIGKL